MHSEQLRDSEPSPRPVQEPVEPQDKPDMPIREPEPDDPNEI